MIRIEHVIRATCAEYGLSVADIKGPCRKASLAHPRMLAMALSRELTGRSFPLISAYFGGRDHTTCLHAAAAVARWRKQPEFAFRMERVTERAGELAKAEEPVTYLVTPEMIAWLRTRRIHRLTAKQEAEMHSGALRKAQVCVHGAPG